MEITLEIITYVLIGGFILSKINNFTKEGEKKKTR